MMPAEVLEMGAEDEYTEGQEARGEKMSEVKTLYKKIKLLEDELAALKRDARTVFLDVAQREHWAEEYECAMMHLNDLGVPKDDGKGNTYSLVGRILKLGVLTLGVKDDK